MGQILAIVGLRFRLLANGLRGKGSWFNLVSGTVVILFVILLSLGLATGMGALAFTGVSQDRSDLLHFAYLGAFWAAITFGVLMPLALSSGGAGMSMSRLLVFPVSRRKLFGISIGSAFLSPDHLFYYPTFLATFVFGVLATDAQAALGLAFFLLVVLSVVFWAHTLMAILQGVVSHRRSKEWIGMIGFGILVTGGVLPAIFTRYAEQPGGASEERIVVIAEVIAAVASSTPPNLAADGLSAMHEGDVTTALLSLSWLGVWALMGLAMAYLAFSRIALKTPGGGGGPRPVERVIGERGRDITELVPFLPIEVLAVASKELRYLLRSSVGRFNLVMIPLFVAVIAFVLAPNLESPLLGVAAEDLALYGMLLYVVLFSNNMMNNAFSWEGAGLKMYLLSPVPFERIMLGKNLGVWAYNAVMFVICITTWIVLVDFPGASSLITGALLFASAVVLFATMGNFVSISFPVARNISSMKSTPSQAAIFLSLGILLELVAVNAFFLGMPSLLGIPETRPLFLLGLFLCSIGAHRLSLRPVAKHFAERKEALLATVEGVVE